MRIIAAAAVLAATIGGAYAQDATADVVGRKFGEAMALARLCPLLEINSARMSAYSYALGLEIDDAMKAVIARHHASTIKTMNDRPRDVACAIGRTLYGPEGENAPGILVEKM